MRARGWPGGGMRWWVLLLCCGASGAPPACPPGARCEVLGSAVDEYKFRVDGEELNISFKDSGYVEIKCAVTATLDSPALPRFPDEARVTNVFFRHCPPPNSSYAHALRTLNVVALDRLEIDNARDTVRRAHLAELGVGNLVLMNLHLDADALDDYNATSLLLDSVNVSSASVLERLPASLRALHLVNMGVRSLRRAALERFPALRRLTVRDDGEVRVEAGAAGAALTELALDAERVWLAPALGRLRALTLYNWAERAPAPWAGCGALERLVLSAPAARALPPAWLAGCSALRELRVERAAGLRALSGAALRGAARLESVTLSRGALAAVPSGLLDDAVLLSYLNLSGNRLTDLPSGLFSKTRRLATLDLSHNELSNGTFAKLEALTALRRLVLRRNARLGDACPVPHGISALQDLRELRELDLSATGASRICRDFVENMYHLEKLNLSKNNITYLKFADLQFRAAAAVDLSGNNVTALLYSADEYRLLTAHRAQYCAPGAPLAARATVHLSAPLACDCRLVWAALALRECPAHARLPAARCASGRALAAEPLDALLCPLAPCAAPPPCRCAWRPHVAPGAGAEGARVVRVACERAGLRAVPRLAPARGVRWQLALADNSIASLRRADLPPDLLSLDLRRNGLRALHDDALAALAPNASAWLGGNALACDCEHAAALAALERRRALVRDADALRCAGGGPLAPPECARPGPLLGAVLAPLALLALLLGGALARRGVRARLKAALRGAGLLAAAREEDDGRPYDVFVSFSHADAAVAERLLAGLEPRYRVCVHWRDWAPGAWIPAQIAASVARSRRTLALVSAHYLRSAWARAEFREAHGAALRDAVPRLVVVLLAEPRALALDAELRRYLRAHTYVRWGDAWFWPKLRAALPRPRPPLPPGEEPELPPAPRAAAGAAAA